MENDSKQFLDQAPKIIEAASKSPLGIVSLVILAMSVLGYLFFSQSPEWVRVCMFAMMFGGYGLLCLNLVKTSAKTPNLENENQKLESAAQKSSESPGNVSPTLEEKPKRAKKRGRSETIPEEIGHRRLSLIWFGGTSFLFVILLLQSLLGRYGAETFRTWVWFGPLILPPVSVVIASLAYAARNPRKNIKVSRVVYGYSSSLSLLYIFAMCAAFFLEPFTAYSSLEWKAICALFLSPLEGVVVLTLCLVLMSRVTR